MQQVSVHTGVSVCVAEVQHSAVDEGAHGPLSDPEVPKPSSLQRRAHSCSEVLWVWFCASWTDFQLSLFLTVLLRLTFNLWLGPVESEMELLGFYSGWICWDVHSWDDCVAVNTPERSRPANIRNLSSTDVLTLVMISQSGAFDWQHRAETWPRHSCGDRHPWKDFHDFLSLCQLTHVTLRSISAFSDIDRFSCLLLIRLVRQHLKSSLVWTWYLTHSGLDFGLFAVFNLGYSAHMFDVSWLVSRSTSAQPCWFSLHPSLFLLKQSHIIRGHIIVGFHLYYCTDV